MVGVTAEAEVSRESWRIRIFGSRTYSRLWTAQVVSSMGDWIGFLAIAAAAARVAGGSPETAIGLVMSARILPGFFLAPVAGVLVDRWDRKRVMVVCDLGRAATLCVLPFITHVWQLLIASLILEVFTLLWAPAKEATVPELVPPDRLTNVNSLSLAAAYGTFPFASALFALLAGVAAWLGTFDSFLWFSVSQESVAFWFDTATFLFSALMIARLPLPPHRPVARAATTSDVAPADEAPAAPKARRKLGVSISHGLHDLREGWRFVALDPTVRAVHVGLACGLVGGAMIVPLGPVFSTEVLHSGAAGFGLLTTALGVGVALGVLGLSVLQKRLPKGKVFSLAVVVAGCGLLAAASVASLSVAVVAVAMVGVGGGGAYVLGFTLLHESVDNRLRGRVFGALFTLVRLCVLIAFALAPLLSALLGNLSSALLVDQTLAVGQVSVAMPGVRLTLWLAGCIVIGAGLLARRSLRAAAAGHLRALDEHPTEETAVVVPPLPLSLEVVEVDDLVGELLVLDRPIDLREGHVAEQVEHDAHVVDLTLGPSNDPVDAGPELAADLPPTLRDGTSG